MTQIKLIDIEDIKQIRAISDVINADKEIMPFVSEVQDTDIKRLLGEEMYADLMINYDGEEEENTTPEKYLELLNGKQYTYNGKNYLFNGLKQIIAYYTYYAFVKQWGVHITNAGLQVKTGDFSLPVEDATRGRLIGDIKSKLVVFVQDLNNFLKRNMDIYTLSLVCSAEDKCKEDGQFTLITSKMEDRETWH